MYNVFYCGQTHIIAQKTLKEPENKSKFNIITLRIQLYVFESLGIKRDFLVPAGAHAFQHDSLFKVIPQKLKFPMNFFKTFPECSLPSTVSKKTIKMIGHHSRLRDMMGQSYPIYACTRAI